VINITVEIIPSIKAFNGSRGDKFELLVKGFETTELKTA
jgi:hypothetical protein